MIMSGVSAGSFSNKDCKVTYAMEGFHRGRSTPMLLQETRATRKPTISQA